MIGENIVGTGPPRPVGSAQLQNTDARVVATSEWAKCRNQSNGDAVYTRFSSTRIAAVVPAYNEDRFIGSLVLKARQFVDDVIVVDDGSTDQTADVAGEAGARVVSHLVNQGKASALKTGFVYACHTGADIIVTLDGDGQHDPAQIPAIVQPILAHEADMVVGSRFRTIENQIPAWRRFGQHTLTFVTNAASGTMCSDSQSGFRAFTRQALQTFDIHCAGFAVESEMQFWAHEQALRVAEVPISCVYVEKSKRNPVRQGIQVLEGILSMVSEFRPLLFFGLGGILLALVGMGCWCQIVLRYHSTGQLQVGMALLATLLTAVGVLTSFQGITMHLLRKMMRHLLTRPPQLSADIDIGLDPLGSGASLA
jgi:glycosyltransferase involved in cell wall biosynthesis